MRRLAGACPSARRTPRLWPEIEHELPRVMQIGQVYLDDIAGRGQNLAFTFQHGWMYKAKRNEPHIAPLYHSPRHCEEGGRFGMELDCGWWDRETGNQVENLMWRLKQLLNLLVGQVSDILLHDEHNFVHLKTSSEVIALEKLNINVGKRRTLWIRTERRKVEYSMVFILYKIPWYIMIVLTQDSSIASSRSAFTSPTAASAALNSCAVPSSSAPVSRLSTALLPPRSAPPLANSLSTAQLTYPLLFVSHCLFPGSTGVSSCRSGGGSVDSAWYMLRNFGGMAFILSRGEGREGDDARWERLLRRVSATFRFCDETRTARVRSRLSFFCCNPV